MAEVAKASDVDNIDILLDGDDDNCVTVESARLDLSMEEALLAADPEDEDMEKKEEVKGEDEVKISSDTQPTPDPDLPINGKMDTKEVSKLDDKFVKEEDKKDVTDAIALTMAAKTEDEDDIIVLDEDEPHGAIFSKLLKNEEDDDIMEVDESGMITKEDRNSVGNIIRKMKRQDLEDLVLAKIVEGIVAHTEVGQLRGKVVELQQQKDKMASKLGVMMKQVGELSSAVNGILENEQRDPKNRIGKPHVIRFNRSVGLQASIEQSVRTAAPTIIRVPDPTQNEAKPRSGKGAANGVFQVPQPQAVKRGHQGGKAGDKSSPPKQSNNVPVPSPRKVYSPVTTMTRTPQAPPNLLPIVQKTNAPFPAAAASQNSQPGFVDLTDDDPDPTPPATTTVVRPTVHVPATVNTSAVGRTETTLINGVQYQIVNRPATPSSSASIQIVPTNGQRYIAAPGGQSRPVFLQQLGNNQPTMLREFNNPPVRIMQQTQIRPRPPQNMGPRVGVAATIPVRGAPGSVLGVNGNMQLRFTLPPLPPTPPSKIPDIPQKPPVKLELGLALGNEQDGIVVSWKIPAISMLDENMAEVTTYQIFACQEHPNKPGHWKRVGDVKALPLPMACTLSQFTDQNRYHFIVRGIDLYGRVGPWCEPKSIRLESKK